MSFSFERLRNIVESVNAIIWEYNIENDSWDYVSPQVKEMLGYTPEEWIDLEFWVDNIHREDRNWAKNYCFECAAQGKDHIFEYRFFKKDGDYIWLRDEVVVIMEEGTPIKLRGFMTDISDLKKREENIKHISFHDSLTGLYNREFLDAEIERLDVKRQLPISLIMIDLNGLKLINDSYGHKIGDKLLIKTAELLKNIFREEDIIARWGGDEFVILLNKTPEKAVEQMITRIKNKNSIVEINDSQKIPLSFSIGYSIKKDESINTNDLFKKAENYMYEDKLLKKQSTSNHIVKTLLSTLQQSGDETKEHGERMNQLAVSFGKKLELSLPELNRLALLAILHDIGKITIPSDILKKPTELSPKEWSKVKEHPATGYRICSEVKEFSHIAQEILTHHERWDGRGYPQGLKGEEIPLLARIISIVDSYDVMTNDRVYKKKKTKKEALEELRSCSGSQFDPNLVKSFEQLLNQGKFNDKFKKPEPREKI